MTEQKKKISRNGLIVIISASIVAVVVLVILALPFINFITAKPYCSYYTAQQAQMKSLNDRESTALNDTCLEERGWGS